MSLNYLVTYYAFETTKSILWWGGTQVLYLLTPPVVYRWATSSKKTETERLLDEIRLVREELRELNKKKISDEEIVELDNTIRGVVSKLVT